MGSCCPPPPRRLPWAWTWCWRLSPSAPATPAVDSANVEMFAKLVAEARSVGLPIGGEVYPGVYGQVSPEAFHELISQSCRIVSELGADFIKTFYTGPHFNEIVKSTPVPLICLGADKVEEIQALGLAEKAVQAGRLRRGVGRNVFEGRARRISWPPWARSSTKVPPRPPRRKRMDFDIVCIGEGFKLQETRAVGLLSPSLGILSPFFGDIIPVLWGLPGLLPMQPAA